MNSSANPGFADAPQGDARELGRSYGERFGARELDHRWEGLAPEPHLQDQLQDGPALGR